MFAVSGTPATRQFPVEDGTRACFRTPKLLGVSAYGKAPEAPNGQFVGPGGAPPSNIITTNDMLTTLTTTDPTPLVRNKQRDMLPRLKLGL